MNSAIASILAARDRAELKRVAAPIAARIGLTPEDLFAKTEGARARPLPALRRKVYATLLDRGWSYPRIGRAAGRDHSTIVQAMHGHGTRGPAIVLDAVLEAAP